jgi:hypothetical protein
VSQEREERRRGRRRKKKSRVDENDTDGIFEDVKFKPDTRISDIEPFLERVAGSEQKQALGKKKGKVKARSRGTCVFPSTHGSVKDNKDHYPINDEDQARNALARASQHKSSPPWYSGSLQGLVSAVRGAVKRKFPSIKTTEKSKKPKKGFDLIEEELTLTRRGTLSDIQKELRTYAIEKEAILESFEDEPEDIPRADEPRGGLMGSLFDPVDEPDEGPKTSKSDPRDPRLELEEGEELEPKMEEPELEEASLKEPVLPSVKTPKDEILGASKLSDATPEEITLWLAEEEKKEPDKVFDKIDIVTGMMAA